ncbi:hypothetical protein NE237_015571 [Protea cynaroides]|uniref:Pectinesterase inhibitor domain-containing protein n=1 Tax=Protea cynaroides TaxID=273540 RepID=A0A9Q0KEA8_9MAGN|nr:hypothetical protein NE237_015571 [Protea cynaroides]
MESVSRFFFLLPLVLSVSLISNPCEAQGDDLIHKICAQTKSNDLCIATLRSEAKNSNPDIKSLAAISIQNLISTANRTSDKIAKMLNTTTDPSIQKCLSDCSKAYTDALDQLDGGLAALDTNSYSDINKAVFAAKDAVQLCAAGFSSDPDHAFMLRSRNNLFSELCTNAVTIVHQLAGSTA